MFSEILDIKHFTSHHAFSCYRLSRLTLPVTALGLLLSGCTSIWNASDLAVWVRDQAVDQGCQRETIELENWYAKTAEGNVWRGAAGIRQGPPNRSGSTLIRYGSLLNEHGLCLPSIGGGWTSSYTGEPLSRAEMAEYGDNILKKLEPLLHRDMRVLEIGCASGISMFRLAPRVGYYHGTDLSAVIIDKNRQRVEQEGHENIRLSCCLAHEIDRLGEGDFDLVIINSVIQCFHGHNYLRSVMGKSVFLLKRIKKRAYLNLTANMPLGRKALL